MRDSRYTFRYFEGNPPEKVYTQEENKRASKILRREKFCISPLSKHKKIDCKDLKPHKEE